MNLQLLRHGIGTRTRSKTAGFALAALLGALIAPGAVGMGASAWAQVASPSSTRTHLSLNHDAQAKTTLTARVGDVVGNPATGGTVNFVSAQGSLGSAFVENGVATLTVDKLPQGTQLVTAAFSGNENFAASSASAAAAPAESALADFALTGVPSTLTLSPGQSGSVTITVTPENGFNSLVTLSCSNVPNPATCVFSPMTLTPISKAAVISTLQIQTQAISGTSASLRHSSVAYAIVLPGILALVGIGALRRRSGLTGLRVLGILMLLVASSAGLTACSARFSYLNHPPSPNPGVAAGTYNITVSGFASINGTSVTSHNLNVTLTVK